MAKMGNGRGRFILLVLGLALVTTLIYTYPLARQWRSHIVGYEGADAFNHAWGAWWFNRAIFTEHQSPATVDAIYYPAVVHHPIQMAMPWSRLVGIIGVRLADPIIAYNAHLFLSYLLTWLFMSLFCLKLTGNRIAAVLGGAIFTFCANRTANVFWGHFGYVLAYPLPLLALTFWNLMERPTIGRGLLFGVALIMASTVDVTILPYFVLPLMVGLFLFYWRNHRQQLRTAAALKGLGAGLALSAFALLPLMWPMVAGDSQGDLDWYEMGGVGDHSADAFAYLVPPPQHPLSQLLPPVGALSTKIDAFLISNTEGVVYAGWITMILAFIGVVRFWEEKRDVILWTTFAVVGYLLSLGPVLRAAGQLVTLREQWVLLPYLIVMQLPVLGWGRTPARLSLLVMFALSILAAYGVTWLMGKISRPAWQWAAGAGLFILILVDSTVLFPWPMVDAQVPPYYEQVAADLRPVAVLDIPTTDYDAAKYHMRYQMVHNHPIVGGFSIRRPLDVEETMEELEAFALPGGDPAALADHNIGYIILHRDFLEADDLEETAAFLTNEIGPPAYHDDRIVAFALP
jgi:hypothetical protein